MSFRQQGGVASGSIILLLKIKRNTTVDVSSFPEVVTPFGELGKMVTLNGVNQYFALNLNGTAITGGNLTATIEWTEE